MFLIFTLSEKKEKQMLLREKKRIGLGWLGFEDKKSNFSK